tara:strand:+ start:43 stop:165 length:123 start_codon:yes stop_codon:yes gene_type:complete
MISFSPRVLIGISRSEKIAKIVKRIVKALIIENSPFFNKK